MNWIKKGGLVATVTMATAIGAAQYDPEYGLDTVSVDQLRVDWRGWVGLDEVEGEKPAANRLTARLAFELEDFVFERPVAASAIFQKAWEYNRERTRVWLALSAPDEETGVRRVGVRALRLTDKGQRGNRMSGEALPTACPEAHADALACYEVEWLSRRCEACRGWGLLAIHEDAHDGLRIAGHGLGVLPPTFAKRVIVPAVPGDQATDLASLLGKLLVPTRVDLDEDDAADAWRVEMQIFGRLVAGGEKATAKPLINAFLAEHGASAEEPHGEK